MIRTQVYITEAEKAALARIGRRTGSRQSELIRRAIDRLIHDFSIAGGDALKGARGMWADRSPKDFKNLRAELDR